MRLIGHRRVTLNAFSLFSIQLALQFHPDKCGAPGTDDAFKGLIFDLLIVHIREDLQQKCVAIGHAFAVLGDRDKKAAYDVYGVDPESAGGRRPPPSSRGHPMHHNFAARSGYQSFDGDISPEDLFNMFFGDMGVFFIFKRFLNICMLTHTLSSWSPATKDVRPRIPHKPSTNTANSATVHSPVIELHSAPASPWTLSLLTHFLLCWWLGCF